MLNRSNGMGRVNDAHVPQSSAWSGAYRMLQSAHEKLQAKYDQLKTKKLQDLINECERQQQVLMDHERKADELVHHLRNEADRQRDIASRAEARARRRTPWSAKTPSCEKPCWRTKGRCYAWKKSWKP